MLVRHVFKVSRRSLSVFRQPFTTMDMERRTSKRFFNLRNNFRNNWFKSDKQTEIWSRSLLVALSVVLSIWLCPYQLQLLPPKRTDERGHALDLFVCRVAFTQTNYERIIVKFLWGAGHAPRRKWSHFVVDLDFSVDCGSLCTIRR